MGIREVISFLGGYVNCERWGREKRAILLRFIIYGLFRLFWMVFFLWLGMSMLMMDDIGRGGKGCWRQAGELVMGMGVLHGILIGLLIG